MMDFVTDFDDEYRSGAPPWVIGAPQPVLVELAEQGRISGSVLDVGCGTGENAIFLASLGYLVVGVDSSPTALEMAKTNAAAKGCDVEFEVRDALELHGDYDTVIDCGLFHVNGLRRSLYVESLSRVTHRGSQVYVLALADIGPRYGPQVSQSKIRAAFADGWRIESIRPSSFLCRSEAGIVDAPAWLASIERSTPALIRDHGTPMPS